MRYDPPHSIAHVVLLTWSRACGSGSLGGRLRRRLFLDLGVVVSNDATDRRARHRMMTGNVPDDTAHGGPFQTALRGARIGKKKTDGSGHDQDQE
jgi:hypothetical protein